MSFHWTKHWTKINLLFLSRVPTYVAYAQRWVVTKYIYLSKFWEICTFKSRFKDGYFYFNLSTFLKKKSCTFTSLYLATFLSLLNFDQYMLRNSLFQGRRLFYLGQEPCPIRE